MPVCVIFVSQIVCAKLWRVVQDWLPQILFHFSCFWTVSRVEEGTYCGMSRLYEKARKAERYLKGKLRTLRRPGLGYVVGGFSPSASSIYPPGTAVACGLQQHRPLLTLQNHTARPAVLPTSQAHPHLGTFALTASPTFRSLMYQPSDAKYLRKSSLTSLSKMPLSSL